ncbi:MAG TPA: hypothetical protein VG077_13825 [Verrucomicrobiae bacterium]|nr:hypothetical protein [Verrucomicrobiae bacterium]
MISIKNIRHVIAHHYVGSLTDAMLGLVQRSGSDAQANMAGTSEIRRVLQSPR